MVRAAVMVVLWRMYIRNVEQNIQDKAKLNLVPQSVSKCLSLSLSPYAHLSPRSPHFTLNTNNAQPEITSEKPWTRYLLSMAICNAFASKKIRRDEERGKKKKKRYLLMLFVVCSCSLACLLTYSSYLMTINYVTRFPRTFFVCVFVCM